MAGKRDALSFVDRRQGDTLVNVAIGAAVIFVINIVPGIGILGGIAGGAAAGYLQNEGKGTGGKVGAIAGGVAAIPSILLVFAIFGGLGLSAFGGPFAALFGELAILLSIVVFVILVILGAIGGVLGGAVAEDPYPSDRQPRGQAAGERHLTADRNPANERRYDEGRQDEWGDDGERQSEGDRW